MTPVISSLQATSSVDGMSIFDLDLSLSLPQVQVEELRARGSRFDFKMCNVILL